MSPKPAVGIAFSALVALLLVLAWAAPSPARRRAPEGSRLLHRTTDAREIASPSRSVDELTASIAHEINQPLSAILANVDAGALLWKQQPLPADELKAILADVRADVLHIKQIIQKLRTLLGKRSLEAEVLDLNDVIARSRNLLDRLAKRHDTQLHVELAAGPLLVMGDSTHLQQVLVNLATNGMEAMAHLPPQRRLLKLASGRGDKNAAVFMVSDNGAGVTPDTLPEIFKVFYSTKPEGMGMGLAIVRTIVDAHAGSIDVEIGEQGRTVFKVSLPAVAVARRRAGRAPLDVLSSA